ncbi:MAG: hypothetical protein K2N35_15615, partial [Muribaculaceae bacterium]|nr:hypothetical protein [Muribaculaceae bacterium]
KILVTALSILFLLIAIKTSYPADDTMDMILTISGKFLFSELILFVTIYVFGDLLSDAVPGIWEKAKDSLQKIKAKRIQKRDVSKNDTKDQPSQSLPSNNKDGEDEEKNTPLIAVEIPDEIIEYTNKTFENILTLEQIEKIFGNLRSFNNGGNFEVIEKVVLPDYIYQFDILHLVWNICKRIYDKRYCNYKFRDRAAEFAKSSFPLTVTSTIEVISATMTNDDKTHSLPIIKLGKPLIPHDFSEVRERMAKKS